MQAIGKFNVDEQKAKGYFGVLETIDFTTIKRIEPEDIPEGGNPESYTIIFENGDEFSLDFDPGVMYTNSELFLSLTKTYIKSLKLPDVIHVLNLFPEPWGG